MPEVEGVIVKQLKQIFDERGKISHMMRRDDPNFVKFGEIYFSTVYPNVVKAWHLHKIQTDNFCVIKGMAKVVLYDDREGSRTRGNLMELLIGEQNYVLVSIPPGVIHGIKGIGTEPAIIANCCTEPYNEKDEFRIDPYNNNIPYDWEVKEK